MGNSAATLVVTTTQKTYTAGSQITGRVYLNVNSKGPISANSLNVRIWGLEKTVVHYTSQETRHHQDNRDSTRTHTNHHYARSTRNIFHLNVPLSTFPDGMVLQPGGQYEFPFEVVLPQQLPSSMTCQNGKSSCDILYGLQAFSTITRGAGDGGESRGVGGLFSSLSSGGGSTYFSSKVRPIRIVACPPTASLQQSRVIAHPETSRVNFCCCINRGTMTLSAECDRSIVSPGESAVGVAFDCHNDSTVDVNGAKVELEEVVCWSAKGRSETFRRTVARRALPPAAISGARGKRFKAVAEAVREEMGRAGYGRLITNEGGEDGNHVALNVSSQARDTYNGALVQVLHRIVVTLETPCCMNSPEVVMNVRIVPSRQAAAVLAPSEEIPQAHVVGIRLPEDWHPQTAEVASLPVAHAIWGGDEEELDDVHGGASAPPLEIDEGYIPPPATSPEYA